MPQVLKEEIREKIEKSAVDEFYEKGYKFATMKNIASNSGIPTGLIYSYYKNKEDLFRKIVSPICILLDSMIKHNNVEFNNTVNNLFENELPQIMSCIHKYHKQLVILIDKSIGSPFAHIKGSIIDDVTLHLKNSTILKDSKYDNIFYHILAANFMEGIFEIARHYVDKKWAEDMLNLLIKQYLYGVSSLSK
jgi:AcrR family transcriptional regulator